MKEWKHLAYHRFILWNTVLFGFAILYLGIHWIVDIPLGILIGGIGALFIHHLQPRLRNDFGSTFEGINRTKFGRHALFEGIVVLLMVALLMGSLDYQEATMDERPSMVLGPEDSNFDIIQPISEGENATFIIRNMDESKEIEVILIKLSDSISAMNQDDIDWEELSGKHTPLILNPNQQEELIIDEDGTWHLAIVHHPGEDGTVEVHIKVEYSGDVPVNLALLLSIPSLWMTGFVIHRLIRLKAEGLPLSDSRPSHSWSKSDESE